MDNEQNNAIIDNCVDSSRFDISNNARKLLKTSDKVSKLTFIVTCKTMTKKVFEQLKDLTKGRNCRIIIVETHARRA
jgi:aminoglycoside phosphotransferase family enzyme